MKTPLSVFFFVLEILTIPDIQRIRPIKEMLPVSIGYGHLKLVITMLEITYGVTNDPRPKPDLEKFQWKSTVAAPKVSRNSIIQFHDLFSAGGIVLVFIFTIIVYPIY